MLDDGDLRAAVERAADGVAFLDPEGHHLYLNPAYARLLGYEDRKDLLGVAWTDLYPADEVQRIRREVLPALEEEATWRGDLLAHRLHEGLFSQEVSLTRLPGDRLLVIVRSLGEHGAIQKRLERMAFYDPLTGLANRRLLEEKARQALALARRKRQSVGLIYMDLDGFKEVNDTLGHGVGDRTLEETASRIRDCIREADTAARVGGDEFAVLLGEVEGEDGAIRVAERILARLREPFRVDEHEVRLGSSIGVAFFPRYASDFEELLRQADLAMYGEARSKEVGVRIFRPEAAGSPHHSRLLDELHVALRHYRLAVHYQPVRRLSSGELVGARALARWPHPRLGILSAAKFLPLVEEVGLVGRLDRWVVATSLLQLESWSERGFPGWVAVHLSEESADDPGFAEYLGRALGSVEEVDPERLVLQLPARAMIREGNGLAALAGEIRELGASVAVDAMSVENASARYLRGDPPNFLNLDRSLVGGARAEERRTRLLRTVVELAHSLGTRVLAKGVERGRERELLRSVGCDFAAGYLVGWSVPPEEFLDGGPERKNGELPSPPSGTTLRRRRD